MTFLDVGTADCAVIRTPLGQTILVDAGDEEAGPTVYPSADVIDRLTKVGARVLRTDRDGNVSVSTSGADLYVSTARTSR